MRIGYDTLIENPLNPSSAIHFMKSLLRALVVVGAEHEFFVFVSPRNRASFVVEASNAQPVNCFFSNERTALRILVQQAYLPLLARRLRLDVILGINQIPFATRVPTVVKTCGLHHHETPQEFNQAARWRDIPWNRLRRVYRHWAWDGSARRATMVIANSNATREGIVRHMKVPEAKVRVVLESVDDAFAHVDRASARAIVSRDMGIEGDYVLYVSNLWYYKNPDGAIRAFAAMCRSHAVPATLVVAGPDDYQRIPALTRLAQDHGVAERVRFVGRVPRTQLVALYGAARAVFYPSLSETFGKPVVEGMKAGVPVVTSNRTSLPEVAGGAALLVNPDDEDAMGEALFRAMFDDGLRHDLIARGRARGCEFSWERTAIGTLDVCREAVERARGRRSSAGAAR